MLRKMVRGGFRRKPDSWAYILTNTNLIEMCKTESIESFIERQKQRFLAHIIRMPDKSITKRIIFNDEKNTKRGRTTIYIDSTLDCQDLTEFCQNAKNCLV